MDLGRRLRELRCARSLSLYEVGERIHLHFSTIGKYERGKRRPSLAVLRALAALYEVDLVELLAAEDPSAGGTGPLPRHPRPDLDVLVDLAGQLTPVEVVLLTDFLRVFMARANGPRGTAGAPADPAGVAGVPVLAAEGPPPWSEPPAVPAGGTGAPGTLAPRPALSRHVPARATGRLPDSMLALARQRAARRLRPPLPPAGDG